MSSATIAQGGRALSLAPWMLNQWPARTRSSCLTRAQPRAALRARILPIAAERSDHRASLLLVRELAAHDQPVRHGGRIVLLTSGQHRGPMPGEIPYAVTKGALQQITATLADALADRGITVNCVNPGPTDTGWASPDQAAFVARHMPRGRWNSPDERPPWWPCC